MRNSDYLALVGHMIWFVFSCIVWAIGFCVVMGIFTIFITGSYHREQGDFSEESVKLCIEKKAEED